MGGAKKWSRLDPNDCTRVKVRALAVVTHERYNDPKDYPRKQRHGTNSLLNVLDEPVCGGNVQVGRAGARDPGISRGSFGARDS